jgi:DNA-binding GntR family transcriptional regulator
MEHVAIAQALLDRDAPLAERLMREHLSHFLEAAERYRAEQVPTAALIDL